MYEPLARPLYDLPDRDPFAPKATGGSHAPEAEVGPERVQVSVRVAFGFLLYVNANVTELVVSVAPSAGDGETNVTVGRPDQASAGTMPTIATTAPTTTAFRRS